MASTSVRLSLVLARAAVRAAIEGPVTKPGVYCPVRVAETCVHDWGCDWFAWTVSRVDYGPNVISMLYRMASRS